MTNEAQGCSAVEVPGVPRVTERLAVAAGVVILALWAWALLVQVPNFNYSDSFGPALVALGQLTLVPDSVVTWFYTGAQTVLPLAIAGVCRALGVSPESVHTAIAVGTAVAGLSGLGYAAARIAGTWWSGVLAIIAVPFAWPFALSIGYYAPFWTGYSTAGYWGLGWTCAVWGLWLVSPAAGVRAMAPFALAGLVFTLHPTWGLVLLTVLGIGEGFAVLGSPNRADAVRAAALRLAVAGVMAAPQAWLILVNLGQAVTPEADAAWWPLIQFRKSFHFYLWDDVVSYGRLAKMAIVIGLSTAVAWPLLDRTRRQRAAATAVGVAMLVSVAYVVIQVVPIRSISALVLTRSVSLLAAASAVFLAAAVMGRTSVPGARGLVRHGALWVALLGFAVPIEAPGWSAVSQGFSQRMPDVIRTIGNDTVSFIVTAAALMVALAARSGPAPLAPRPRWIALVPTSLAVLVAAALTLTKLPLIPVVQGAAPVTATWDGLTTYLREQTPAEALMVMPPYPYSIASARRSFVLDYSLLGAAVYNPPMASFEMRALRALYGISLDGMSHDAIRAYLAAHQGILCLLEGEYRALLASEPRVRALKHEFPTASFLVGFKPGVTPLEWVCGAHDAPALPLPVAYENAEYLLYDLRADPPAPPPVEPAGIRP